MIIIYKPYTSVRVLYYMLYDYNITRVQRVTCYSVTCTLVKCEHYNIKSNINSKTKVINSNTCPRAR